MNCTKSNSCESDFNNNFIFKITIVKVHSLFITIISEINNYYVFFFLYFAVWQHLFEFDKYDEKNWREFLAPKKISFSFYKLNISFLWAYCTDMVMHCFHFFCLNADWNSCSEHLCIAVESPSVSAKYRKNPLEIMNNCLISKLTQN